MISLRNSLLVAAALCGLILTGAGAASACGVTADLGAATNSGFGNNCSLGD
ncbi:hypothetical protein [Kitasatospora sp. LaBMicrA B282]|uniref:hypothetical protein n=1 Tax=Kitasatospora sp. LaBMicrA B282 TaxID=3420949 RepID=UPI003D130781